MKKIGYILLLIISITTITGCGCEKKKEEKKLEDVKVNTNKEVIKDQTLEVFTFTKTSLVYEDNMSYLTTLVKNTSNEKQYLQEFTIHVKDKEGNDIVALPGYVGDYLEAGEEKYITRSYKSDLTSAANIEYEIKR